jgi:multidrug resistance protein, MATE family
MTTLSYSTHFKQNLKIAIPVCLSQVGHVMVGVVDSIMVGALGKEPLAAAALSNSIFSLPLIFGIGISYGITPLIASADGEKNFKKAGEVFKHGLVINIFTAIVLATIFYLFSAQIGVLDQPEEVVTLTTPYLRILVSGLIPLMIFQAFKQFAEGLSLTKQAMIISIAGNLLNIAGNYILIKGKLGFPALGLNGAAISTTFSRVIMAIGMGIFVFTYPQIDPYRQAFSFIGYSKKVFSSILKISVPSALQFMFEITAFSTATVMMGWIGTMELAAHQIAISLAGLTYMFATGFSSGAVVRVGNYFGMKNRVELRKAGFISFLSVSIFMGFCGMVFIVANKALPWLYIKNEDVIEIASSLLIIAAFFQISDGVQVVGLGALRGIADVKIPTIITFIAYWIIGLPAAYLFGNYFGIGANGIWFGLLLGLTVSAILLFIRFNIMSRRMSFKEKFERPLVSH